MLALGVQVVGWLLISISLPRLPAALTSVVLTIQPVASVLLGIWILSEAPSRLQLLGVVFILAGLLLATVRDPLSARRRRARLGALASGPPGRVDRQGDDEAGALGARVDLDPPAVARHHVVRDVEAEAGALARRLGRVERLEQARPDVRRDARPGVADGDAHAVRLRVALGASGEGAAVRPSRRWRCR